MGASQSQPTTSKASCSRRYSSHAEIEMLFKAEIKSIIQKELSINSENPIDVVHSICAKLSTAEFKDAIIKKCSFSTTTVLVQEKPLAQINESKIEDNLEQPNQAGEHEQVEQTEQKTEQVEPLIQLEQSEPVIQVEQPEPLVELEQAEPIEQLQQTETIEQVEQPEPLVESEQADTIEQVVQLEQPEANEPLIQAEQHVPPEKLEQLEQPNSSV